MTDHVPRAMTPATMEHYPPSPLAGVMPARPDIAVPLSADGQCCRAIDLRGADRVLALRMLYAAAAPLRRDRDDVDRLSEDEARRIVAAAQLMPPAAGVVERVHDREIWAHLGPGVVCTRRWERAYRGSMWSILRQVPGACRMPLTLWACAAERVWDAVWMERSLQEAEAQRRWAMG